MTFDLFASSIAAIVLFLYVGILIWRRKIRGSTSALRFSNTYQIAATSITWKAQYRWLIPALRITVLIVLLIAFARPQQGTEIIKTAKEGIAIQMVFDRSSSMQKEMQYEGQMLPRLEVVKKIFEKFILGDNTKLSGRNNDMIGLISFAGFTEENTPLTLDHQSLVNFSNTIVPASKIEDGTMIGDALYFSTLRLISLEDFLNKGSKSRDSYKVKSKIVILLTDGQQTRGGMSPVEAAEFAKKNAIKIYTIAITSDSAYQQQSSVFGNFFSLGNRVLDTSLLENVATVTNGSFAKASSGEALLDIYHNIDTLEKSSFEERYTTYKEQYHVFVVAGLLLLILELVLAQTLFRKVP